MPSDSHLIELKVFLNPKESRPLRKRWADSHNSACREEEGWNVRRVACGMVRNCGAPQWKPARAVTQGIVMASCPGPRAVTAACQGKPSWHSRTTAARGTFSDFIFGPLKSVSLTHKTHGKWPLGPLGASRSSPVPVKTIPRAIVRRSSVVSF